VDIVSKNGNLMLSVPLRRDGTLDEDERKIVGDIGAWLKVNGEAIYKTRPWKMFGEGPSLTDLEKGKYGGLKDTHSKPLTSEDFRFTQSKDGKTLYAIVHAWPAEGKVTIKALAENSPHWKGKISSVQMLGARNTLKFVRDANGLTITFPDKKPCEIAYVLKIKS
jgi:alpha-L-fucosidase